MDLGKKYLTRSELMKLSDLTKNCLIWYEKKGLLTPKVIGENGYHYYSIEQYFELDLVKTLKWTDLSLEECRSYSESRSEENYLQLLMQQQKVLDDKLKSIMFRKDIIDMTIMDFLMMKTLYREGIHLVSLQGIHLLERQIEDDSPKGRVVAFHELFRSFRRLHALYGIAPSMLHGAVLHWEDVKKGSCNRPAAVCLKLNKPTPEGEGRSVSAGQFVTAFYKGELEQIGNLYSRMLSFMEEHRLEVRDQIMEFEYINYLNEKEPKDYVRQILIPVEGTE